MTDTDVRTAATSSTFFRPQRRRVPFGPAVWLLLVAVVVLVLLSMVGENGLGEYLRLRQQRDGLAQRQEALAGQTQSLEQRLEDLRTNPEALESLARERYNMRREGEQVIRLVTEAEAQKSP